MIDLQIPETVADIITQNKGDLTLSIEAINALSTLIDPVIDGYLMGEVSPAYLIGLTYFANTPKETKDIHVLGIHQIQDCAYATSKIVGVSPDFTQVQTKSGSIYQVSDLQTLEPPLPLILHLCHTLHFWGLGKHFGVLDVYY
jgi:hypothetical protein